jgi:hypothetical protein
MLPFYREIEVCDVVEDIVDHRFVLLFAKELDE